MKKWWDEITNGGPDNTKFSIVVLRGSQKSWWDEIGVLFYLCHFFMYIPPSFYPMLFFSVTADEKGLSVQIFSK